VKPSVARDEQKHFTQRRKGEEGAKKTRWLSSASLCGLATLLAIVYSLTAGD
jgi:hypothetical protein